MSTYETNDFIRLFKSNKTVTTENSMNEQISVEIITPETAASILANNVQNRPVHVKHVDKITAALKDGRWKFNGESIKIAQNGVLVDGQHRLLACVRSGVPIKTVVVRNVDPDTYLTIDIGTKRTSADALGRNGVKLSTHVAAAIRWVLAIEAESAYIGSIILTPDQTMQAFASMPGIELSAEITNPIKLATPAICAALHFVFSKRDANQADRFFADLHMGEGLSFGDPVLTLRNKLISLKISSKVKRYESNSEIAALIIRAWNARRTGRPIRLIKGLVKNDAGEFLMPAVI